MEICQQFRMSILLEILAKRKTVMRRRESSLICGNYRINVLPERPSVTYLKCAETYTTPHTCKMLPPNKILNFWLKFLLGDNKMMTLLPKNASGKPRYCLLVWGGKSCMKLRWILKTGEWALLCLERRFKSSVITVRCMWFKGILREYGFFLSF